MKNIEVAVINESMVVTNEVVLGTVPILQTQVTRDPFIYFPWDISASMM